MMRTAGIINCGAFQTFPGKNTAARMLLFVLSLLVLTTSHVRAFSSAPSSPASCVSACSSPLFRKNLRKRVSSNELRKESRKKIVEEDRRGVLRVTTTKNISSDSLRRKSRDDIEEVLSRTDVKTAVDVAALRNMGYPQGFCKALVRGAKIYCKRYWIIDDSLSMDTTDGHFLLYTQQPNGGDRLEKAPCSRWNELRETCLDHAHLALHLQVATDFCLLNDPQGHFRVPRVEVRNRNNNSKDVRHGEKILSRAKPRGVTPLRRRLERVRRDIRSLVLALGRGQKVALVLATDGMPTEDGEQGFSTPQAKDLFQKGLRQLPPSVSVAIRLCTDDAEVMEYYHALEKTFPNVQVLDDYWAEAERVQEHNPWLTYGLVLHRVREMAGCAHVPLLKQLSQRPFRREEVAEFLRDMFDWDIPLSCSRAELDRAVEKHLGEETPVWNPIRSTFEPWIDLTKHHQHQHTATFDLLAG